MAHPTLKRCFFESSGHCSLSFCPRFYISANYFRHRTCAPILLLWLVRSSIGSAFAPRSVRTIPLEDWVTSVIFRCPSLYHPLHCADVEVPIVQETFQHRHVNLEESPVEVNARPGHF